MFQNGKVTNIELLAPFEFIYPKFLMLIKSFLAVGLIPFIHPASLIYILPAYSLYLISRVTGAFWLTEHYHDFTMTVMYVGCLFSLKAYLENKTFFNKYSLKKKNRFVKFVVISLFIAGIIKLPFWEMIETKNLKERYKAHKYLNEIKPVLDRNKNIWASENLAFYLIDFPKINTIGFHGVNKKIFNNNDAFYLIYPNAYKYSHMSKNTYDELSKKIKEDLASKKCIRLEKNDYLNIIYYNKKMEYKKL